MLNKTKYRKGFMHSLEAMIAAFILLTYSVNIIDTLSDNNDWRLAQLAQESREITEIMYTLGYTDIILGTNSSTFSDIALHFSGIGRMGVAISINNLIKPVLRVGILTSDNNTYVRYQENISQNFFGTNELADVNGKKIIVEIKNTTFSDSWKKFDVLVIPIEGSETDRLDNITLMNDTSSKILNFLQQGGGVIQVSNLSDSNLVNFEVQKSIFGLSWNATSVSDSLSFNFSKMNPSDDGYILRKYFYVSPFMFNMEYPATRNVTENIWWDRTTGVVEVHLGLSNYVLGNATCTVNTPPAATELINIYCGDDTEASLNYSDFDNSTYTINSTNNLYKVGEMSLMHEMFGVLLINSSGLGYDRVYIDINQNFDFSDDGSLFGIVAGERISIGMNQYIIEEIDTFGNYISVIMEPPYYFAGINLDNQVYSRYGFSDYTNRSRYVLVESNVSMDHGGRLPLSVVNYGGFKGRAAWITDNIVSRDEWHLLRNLIFWVAPNEYVLSTVPTNVENVVSTEVVLLSNQKMSQPYLMKLYAWFYDN